MLCFSGKYYANSTPLQWALAKPLDDEKTDGGKKKREQSSEADTGATTC
jgi:hypothetical protein